MTLNQLLTQGLSLAFMEEAVESGKVVAFVGYPHATLVCKLTTGQYACVTEESSTLKSPEVLETFEDFMAGVSEVFGEWLVTMPNWVVTDEALRRCWGCGIPAPDDDFDGGMCNDCHCLARRANGLTLESDTWLLQFNPEPPVMPFQPIYQGETWKPCLIIDGPTSEGYTRQSRVVCDAAGVLQLLNFLKSHEETITKLAEMEEATQVWEDTQTWHRASDKAI